LDFGEQRFFRLRDLGANFAQLVEQVPAGGDQRDDRSHENGELEVRATGSWTLRVIHRSGLGRIALRRIGWLRIIWRRVVRRRIAVAWRRRLRIRLLRLRRLDWSNRFVVFWQE